MAIPLLPCCSHLWMAAPFQLSILESESYVTTYGQPASLSWNKAPIWGLRPDLYYCQTVVGLVMWSALSDERTGLSFIIAAGPRLRSHFRVRVPLDSWTYFTVSVSRLPFSSPPTTRKATVQVFDPASSRDFLSILVPIVVLITLGTDHRRKPRFQQYLHCWALTVAAGTCLFAIVA
jgi:hypothetical protein